MRSASVVLSIVACSFGGRRSQASSSKWRSRSKVRKYNAVAAALCQKQTFAVRDGYGLLDHLSSRGFSNSFEADYLEHKQSEQIQQTIVLELQHRSNNLLAVIQPIAQRSPRVTSLRKRLRHDYKHSLAPIVP
jgi:two-component sensor histidine kinase